MSYSSLYVIEKDNTGSCVSDFNNSWLFSPIIWSVLLDKYMNREIQTPYGYKKSMVLNGNELFRPLNEKINNCKNFHDRICWEMSNQQIFFVKDKDKIADAIMQFVTQNTQYDVLEDDGISSLKREHIISRFTEVADTIKELDESECQYFVFKNTSCDDGVERWFLDDESDNERPISDINEFIAEFVIIADDNTINFKSNLEFFGK